MKNNKVLIGVLLIVVIGIWAKVFFKISDNFQSQVSVVSTSPQTSEKVTIKEREDFELQFSGIDPFLKTKPMIRAFSSSPNRKREDKIQKSTPRMNWPSFKYFGFVKGSNRKTKLSVLKADGTLLNLREGETFFEGYQVKRAYRDSIIIVFGNKSITVYR